MDKKRIVIALSLGVVIIAAFSLVPCKNPLALIILLLFAGIGSWEFYGLLEAGKIPASKTWGTVSGLVLVAATWFSITTRSFSNGDLWAVFMLVLLVNLSRVLVFKELKEGFINCMGTVFGLIYVPLLWSFVVRLFLSGHLDKPGWAAFYVILCMKLADSGGYFFGNKFGKHTLAPVVSPKKTWEGLLGGVVFCTIASVTWYFVSDGQLNSKIPLSIFDALILGVLFPIVGTIGDLVESSIKRTVEVKDSNTMVYGLGGILDMVDSILFAAPMLYIYIEFFIK